MKIKQVTNYELRSKSWGTSVVNEITEPFWAQLLSSELPAPVSQRALRVVCGDRFVECATRHKASVISLLRFWIDKDLKEEQWKKCPIAVKTFVFGVPASGGAGVSNKNNNRF